MLDTVSIAKWNNIANLRYLQTINLEIKLVQLLYPHHSASKWQEIKGWKYPWPLGFPIPLFRAKTMTTRLSHLTTPSLAIKHRIRFPFFADLDPLKNLHHRRKSRLRTPQKTLTLRGHEDAPLDASPILKENVSHQFDTPIRLFPSHFSSWSAFNPKPKEIWQCVKTLYPCSSHQNRWDLWMFIPLKMVFS